MSCLLRVNVYERLHAVRQAVPPSIRATAAAAVRHGVITLWPRPLRSLSLLSALMHVCYTCKEDFHARLAHNNAFNNTFIANLTEWKNVCLRCHGNVLLSRNNYYYTGIRLSRQKSNNLLKIIKSLLSNCFYKTYIIIAWISDCRDWQ